MKQTRRRSTVRWRRWGTNVNDWKVTGPWWITRLVAKMKSKSILRRCVSTPYCRRSDRRRAQCLDVDRSDVFVSDLQHTCSDCWIPLRRSDLEYPSEVSKISADLFQLAEINDITTGSLDTYRVTMLIDVSSSTREFHSVVEYSSLTIDGQSEDLHGESTVIGIDVSGRESALRRDQSMFTGHLLSIDSTVDTLPSKDRNQDWSMFQGQRRVLLCLKHEETDTCSIVDMRDDRNVRNKDELRHLCRWYSSDDRYETRRSAVLDWQEGKWDPYARARRTQCESDLDWCERVRDSCEYLEEHVWNSCRAVARDNNHTGSTLRIDMSVVRHKVVRHHWQSPRPWAYLVQQSTINVCSLHTLSCSIQSFSLAFSKRQLTELLFHQYASIERQCRCEATRTPLSSPLTFISSRKESAELKKKKKSRKTGDLSHLFLKIDVIRASRRILLKLEIIRWQSKWFQDHIS